MKKGSMSYWIKKQIELFCFQPSMHCMTKETIIYTWLLTADMLSTLERFTKLLMSTPPNMVPPFLHVLEIQCHVLENIYNNLWSGHEDYTCSTNLTAGFFLWRTIGNFDMCYTLFLVLPYPTISSTSVDCENLRALMIYTKQHSW